MKRLVVALTATFAAAALVAGIATAGGPPCTNITRSEQTDYYSPAADPDLSWTFVLAAPSCEDVTYILEIYSFTETTFTEQTDLVTLSRLGSGSTTETENFTHTFSEGTAPSDGVCLVGKTITRGRVADRAPNSGCLPVDLTSSGGGSGFS
jgi:hypothetical protein